VLGVFGGGGVSMQIGPKSPGFADCNQPETSLHI